jgi:hypothetical protein
MPHLHAADIIFTLIIGALLLALTVLSFRENQLRSKGK